jgi:hypothetical protein
MSTMICLEDCILGVVGSYREEAVRVAVLVTKRLQGKIVDLPG